MPDEKDQIGSIIPHKMGKIEIINLIIKNKKEDDADITEFLHELKGFLAMNNSIKKIVFPKTQFKKHIEGEESWRFFKYLVQDVFKNEDLEIVFSRL